MDLKNITMDDLKAKFAAIDKKTLIKFGSGFAGKAARARGGTQSHEHAAL